MPRYFLSALAALLRVNDGQLNKMCKEVVEDHVRINVPYLSSAIRCWENSPKIEIALAGQIGERCLGQVSKVEYMVTWEDARLFSKPHRDL